MPLANLIFQRIKSSDEGQRIVEFKLLCHGEYEVSTIRYMYLIKKKTEKNKICTKEDNIGYTELAFLIFHDFLLICLIKLSCLINLT